MIPMKYTHMTTWTVGTYHHFFIKQTQYLSSCHELIKWGKTWGKTWGKHS